MDRLLKYSWLVFVSCILSCNVFAGYDQNGRYQSGGIYDRYGIIDSIAQRAAYPVPRGPDPAKVEFERQQAEIARRNEETRPAREAEERRIQAIMDSEEARFRDVRSNIATYIQRGDLASIQTAYNVSYPGLRPFWDFFKNERKDSFYKPLKIAVENQQLAIAEWLIQKLYAPYNGGYSYFGFSSNSLQRHWLFWHAIYKGNSKVFQFCLQQLEKDPSGVNRFNVHSVEYIREKDKYRHIIKAENAWTKLLEGREKYGDNEDRQCIERILLELEVQPPVIPPEDDDCCCDVQ
jgi:hypothetical protein